MTTYFSFNKLSLNNLMIIMYSVKKCGVKFKPLSLVVTYVDKSTNKLRCRQMPLRNFKESSNVTLFAEEMKKNQRHRSLLNDVSQLQIEKMLLIIRSHLNGNDIDAAVIAAESELTVDPNKDLSKMDTEVVNQAKRIMDEAFNEHRVKPDDPEFEYNVEVEFTKPVVSSGWDSDEDDDEF